MTVERLRLFVGSTELNYESANIIKTNDHIVNEGNIKIEADSNVTDTSTIDFKKDDGSTTIFSAKVIEIREIDMWNIKVFTNGYELMNIRVENVYENQSPEAIVENVIGRTENLTYVSGPASGFTVTKYIAKQYAIDIIKDMIDLLQWQLRIDENDNVYFEPKGQVSTGRTFTHGTNIQITQWEEDKQTLYNKVKVIGGFENFATSEQSGSTGTAFTLEHKPAGAMKVGSAIPTGTAIIDPTLYTVDADNQQVILDEIHSFISFDYTYDKPIIVENQNDQSILDHGEVFEEIQAPFLDTFSDARKYSQNLLDVNSVPEVKAKGTEPEINFDADVGELVTVIDSVRGKEEKLVITKITIKAEGNTEYEFGSRDFVFFDWQRGVQERIKKLERRVINEDDIIFARTFKHTGAGTASINTTFQQRSPNNSFILDHTTLSRLRNDNDERDCSGTANHGVWAGSGTAGTRYGTAGFRLSRGDFNGSDNEVTVATTASGVQSVSMAISPDNNNRDICQLTSTDIISINSSDEITTSGLANVTIYVDNVETTSITLNQFNNVVVTFDAVTADDIKIGHSSSWYDGQIDEFTLFDKKIDSGERQDIIDKIFYSNRDLYSNCLLWFSFDNPKLGNRASTKTVVV